MVIKIDYERCLGAKKCGKCMYECPLGVFSYVPVGKFIPQKLPDKFKIIPFFEDICNGCGICVNVCPSECIILEKR